MKGTPASSRPPASHVARYDINKTSDANRQPNSRSNFETARLESRSHAGISRQIQGIVDITSQPATTRVTSRHFSGFVRGIDITITLDENAFVVNHTSKCIYSSSIEGIPNGGRPIVGGGSGANMDAWGAGIAGTCCASIPRVWYPAMKVLVRWNMPEGIKDVVKEKVVEVEKYERPGSIYLHFFPNDEVRVVITSVVRHK